MRQWDGELITWFPTRSDWERVFKLEMMDAILAPAYVVPTSTSPDAEQTEYQFRTAYVCSRLLKAITSGQAKAIAIKHSHQNDGRKIRFELKSFYEDTTRVDNIHDKYYRNCSNLRFDAYNGTPKQFILQLREEGEPPFYLDPLCTYQAFHY